jgi:hypothetical protein
MNSDDPRLKVYGETHVVPRPAKPSDAKTSTVQTPQTPKASKEKP